MPRREEDKADKATVDHARAVLIAPMLGEGWYYDIEGSIDDDGRPNAYAVLLSPRGRLCISGVLGFPAEYAGKIRIAAELPSGHRGEDFTILVDAPQDVSALDLASAIADEIKRSLLPKLR